MKKIPHYTLTRFWIVIFLTLSIISCKKGNDGTPGRDGTNGQDGSDGRDGNANVKVDTFTVHTADWGYYQSHLNYGQSLILIEKAYDRNFAAINDDVMQNGAVLVFFNKSPEFDGPSAWTPLNYSVAAFYYSLNYYYEVFPGKVKVEFFVIATSVDGNLPQIFTMPNIKYKIVVIGGGVAGNSSIRKNGLTYKMADLKSMSHDQVCEVLSINKD